MDRSDVISLISVSYAKDKIGQQVPAEHAKQVFCAVQSVSVSEFSSAGQLGLRPEYKFTLFAYDYDGQPLVDYCGNRYAVYRTYRAQNEQIELYCERQVGAT